MCVVWRRRGKSGGERQAPPAAHIACVRAIAFCDPEMMMVHSFTFSSMAMQFRSLLTMTRRRGAIRQGSGKAPTAAVGCYGFAAAIAICRCNNKRQHSKPID
jgi:hypothetical protein